MNRVLRLHSIRLKLVLGTAALIVAFSLCSLMIFDRAARQCEGEILRRQAEHVRIALTELFPGQAETIASRLEPDAGRQVAADVRSFHRNALIKQMLGIGILLVTSLGLVMAVSGRLIAPLKRLTHAAGRVASGAFEPCDLPSCASTDEIGRLCESFREMADQVRRLQRQHEQRLEEVLQSQKFLRTVIENIPDMLFLKDAQDLRFVFMNSAGEKLLGISREELIGRCDSDFFPPDQAAFFTEHDRKTLEAGEMDDIAEEPILTRTGEALYLHTKKIPIPGPNGKPDYLLGISRDITPVREAEESQRRFFTNAPDPLCIVGFDGYFRMVNPALAAALGCSAGDLMRDEVFAVIHPDDRDAVRRGLDIIAAGKTVPPLMIRCRHREGNYRWFKWTATGDVTEGVLYAIARDMTEQIELERRIVEAASDEQARLAMDLHDGLGQTLSGLALKAKLLERRWLDGGAPAIRNVREVIWLANHASDQARAIARGMDPVMLKEGLDAALRDLADTTAETEVIACSFAGAPMIIPLRRQDAFQLFKIAQEAVNNALRHSGADRIEIRLTCPGEDVLLEISDNGCGLPAEAPSPQGVGLRNMDYRAHLLGASFEVRNHAERGVIVRCLFHPDLARNQQEAVHAAG